MAAIDFDFRRSTGLLHRVGRAMMSVLDSYALARSRVAELEYYQSLSDARLAELGVERDRIVQHVFRDRMC